jgi:hypothetical protein
MIHLLSANLHFHQLQYDFSQILDSNLNVNHRLILIPDQLVVDLLANLELMAILSINLEISHYH